MRYFKIYADCILTKGINRTTISDTHNKQIYFIPNSISEDLFELKNHDYDLYIEKKELNEKSILKGYIELFIKEGLGFFTKQKKSFPDINLEYFSPEIINNAIIDLDDNSDYELDKIITNLGDFQCKFIQIRIYSDYPIHRLKSFIQVSDTGFLNNIDIIMKYPSDIDNFKLIEKLIREYKIIGKIILHSSIEDAKHKDLNIYKTKKRVTSCLGCGQINERYFSLNLKTISEGQKYNTCLNKKISIDTKGNIKNCPSLDKSFGNIKVTSLQEALNYNGYKKYWTITKDQIEGCKDCEFRYICTDCRAYTEDSKNDYSKPLKCGYNPYTNKWEEWSTHPMKQESIEYYSFDL
jgi:SPASM domain peptide maturase of grasp-with-spasm system